MTTKTLKPAEQFQRISLLLAKAIRLPQGAERSRLAAEIKSLSAVQVDF